jgi:hypothetical protein
MDGSRFQQFATKLVTRTGRWRVKVPALLRSVLIAALLFVRTVTPTGAIRGSRSP